MKLIKSIRLNDKVSADLFKFAFPLEKQSYWLKVNCKDPFTVSESAGKKDFKKRQPSKKSFDFVFIFVRSEWTLRTLTVTLKTKMYNLTLINVSVQ